MEEKNVKLLFLKNLKKSIRYVIKVGWGGGIFDKEGGGVNASNFDL